MNKFKLFFKATKSRLFNHMADYEDAYDEGWAEGQEEGYNEGWAEGKSDAEKLWKAMYTFLKDRKLLDDSGETNSFEMMESLFQYENDLKSTKEEQRKNTQYWRDDAFEVAAKIVDRYVESFGYEDQIARDIRALKKNTN